MLGKNQWWKNPNNSNRLTGIQFRKSTDGEDVVDFHYKDGSVVVISYSLPGIVMGEYRIGPLTSEPIDFTLREAPDIVIKTRIQMDPNTPPKWIKIALLNQGQSSPRPSSITPEKEIRFESSTMK
jgi:hypothetical protein